MNFSEKIAAHSYLFIYKTFTINIYDYSTFLCFLIAKIQFKKNAKKTDLNVLARE